MAREGIGSIIGLAAGAGLLWYAYESGWLASFGFAPAASKPPSTTDNKTPPPNGPGTTPVSTTPPTCSPANTLAQILAKAQAANPTLQLGPGLPGTFTVDQFCYYGDQVCTGLCSQNSMDPGILFPNDPNRGGPMNWTAFAGLAQQHGFSGLRHLAGSGTGGQYVRKGVGCC